MKAFLVSLGCPKNLTDSEVLLGQLAASGYEITTNPAEAETIIVNTCAFLKSARDEAFAVIKEMAQWKKKGKCQQLLIAGCLPKLAHGNRDVQSQVSMLKTVDGTIDTLGLFDHSTPRVKATPPWTAYVKIAEGCDHRCSYCLIPTIRGKYQARPIPDIQKEAARLAKRGVKEIIYVAEDTALYPALPKLLTQTAKIKGIRWIRLLYAHPAHLNEKIIAAMAKTKPVVKYLDLPIQHASDKILLLMNRRYTRADLENLIQRIRRRLPTIALRTTVIVGFPGEGEAEFTELLNFVRRVKFQRLGVFTYRKEDGTPASRMRGQVPERVKILRAKRLMRAQARIARELNNKMIGTTLDVMIEQVKKNGYLGRSFMDAPAIDGTVLVSSPHSIKPGEIVRARITSAATHDLYGFVT